ncbi:hypothetical protein L2719_09350, partial [Shewanella schlegeliana]|uniref:hypothetical protein n=1 Tax=Shewanella schlegeliana TaxID=190308 RepID=UPI00200EA9F5
SNSSIKVFLLHLERVSGSTNSVLHIAMNTHSLSKFLIASLEAISNNLISVSVHTDLLVILLKSVKSSFRLRLRRLGRLAEEAYSTLPVVGVKRLF